VTRLTLNEEAFTRDHDDTINEIMQKVQKLKDGKAAKEQQLQEAEAKLRECEARIKDYEKSTQASEPREK